MTFVTLAPGRDHRSGFLPSFGQFVLAFAVGAGTGAFAAWAYYDGLFNPLAHSFGLWICAVALIGARRPQRRGMALAVVTLIGAVLTFYVGKKVVYGLHYPGLPYPLNASEVGMWVVLAVVGGLALGAVFCRIGRPTRGGAIATATAIGFLAADACRRSVNHPGEGPVLVGFALVATALVLSLAVRSWRQIGSIALYTVPAAVIGYAVVSGPDVLQQLLVDGRPW